MNQHQWRLPKSGEPLEEDGVCVKCGRYANSEGQEPCASPAPAPFADLRIVATVFYGGRVWEVMGKEHLDIESTVFLKNMLEQDKAAILGENFRVREVSAETKRSQNDLVRTVSAFNPGIIDLPTYNRMMYGEGMPAHPEIGKSPLRTSVGARAEPDKPVKVLGTVGGDPAMVERIERLHSSVGPTGVYKFGTPEDVEVRVSASPNLTHSNVTVKPIAAKEDALPAPITVRSEV